MKTINKRLIACAVTAALTVPMTAMATNGYFAHGYGTKNKGLAGGGVALPQDAMIAATNPAGMAFVGERMDLGAAIFSPSSRSYAATGTPSAACGAGGCTFGTDLGEVESDNDFFLIPHFARNWAVGDGFVGLTVYGNGGMNTEYKSGSASFGHPTFGALTGVPGTYGAGTAGVNLEQLFFNTTYSSKFSDKGAWGASVIAAYQTFEAKGLANFGPHSNDNTNLTDNGKDTSTGFGFKFGVQTEVATGVSLGASYQTEIDMSKFDKYSGLFAEQGDFDIPATVTLGLAWNVTPKSTFTADVQQIYYSDVKAISNSVSGLTSPTGCGFTAGDTTKCLGGSNGAGFGWDDMTIIKLGYQWESSDDMTWRVGISQGDQPIPNEEVFFNILAPAVMETHLTMGFTMETGKDSEFNFAAMYAPESSVSGPTGFDPAQTVELKMTQLEVEASWAWKF